MWRGAQAAYDRMLGAVLPEARLRAPALDLAEGRLAAARDALRAAAGGVNRPTWRLPICSARCWRAKAIWRPPSRCWRMWWPQRRACTSRASPTRWCCNASASPPRRWRRWNPCSGTTRATTEARMAKAALLTELGDYAGAAETTATVLADIPDQPSGWLVHGARPSHARPRRRSGRRLATRPRARSGKRRGVVVARQPEGATAFSDDDLAAMEALAAAPRSAA